MLALGVELEQGVDMFHLLGLGLNMNILPEFIGLTFKHIMCFSHNELILYTTLEMQYPHGDTIPSRINRVLSILHKEGEILINPLEDAPEEIAVMCSLPKWIFMRDPDEMIFYSLVYNSERKYILIMNIEQPHVLQTEVVQIPLNYNHVICILRSIMIRGGEIMDMLSELIDDS